MRPHNQCPRWSTPRAESFWWTQASVFCRPCRIEPSCLITPLWRSLYYRQSWGPRGWGSPCGRGRLRRRSHPFWREWSWGVQQYVFYLFCECIHWYRSCQPRGCYDTRSTTPLSPQSQHWWFPSNKHAGNLKGWPPRAFYGQNAGKENSLVSSKTPSSQTQLRITSRGFHPYCLISSWNNSQLRRCLICLWFSHWEEAREPCVLLREKKKEPLKKAMSGVQGLGKSELMLLLTSLYWSWPWSST